MTTQLTPTSLCLWHSPEWRYPNENPRVRTQIGLETYKLQILSFAGFLWWFIKRLFCVCLFFLTEIELPKAQPCWFAHQTRIDSLRNIPCATRHADLADYTRREAGDVWCLPPVWNLRAVIWFHFAISSLVPLPSPPTLSVLSFFLLLLAGPFS